MTAHALPLLDARRQPAKLLGGVRGLGKRVTCTDGKQECNDGEAPQRNPHRRALKCYLLREDGNFNGKMRVFELLAEPGPAAQMWHA